MKNIFCLTFLTIFFVVSAFADSSLMYKYRNMDIAKHGYTVLASSAEVAFGNVPRVVTLVSDKNGHFLIYAENLYSEREIDVYKQNGQEVSKEHVASIIRKHSSDSTKKIFDNSGYTVYGVYYYDMLSSIFFVKNANGKFYEISSFEKRIDVYEEKWKEEENAKKEEIIKNL